MELLFFTDFMPDQLLHTGMHLFKSRSVSALRDSGFGNWTAEVWDKESYPVTIEIEDEHVQTVSCTCTKHINKEYCSHIVAVLLAIQHKEGLLMTKGDLSNLLKKLSVAELQNFMVEEAYGDAVLQDKLIELAGEDEFYDETKDENDEDEAEDEDDNDVENKDAGRSEAAVNRPIGSAAAKAFEKKIVDAAWSKDHKKAKELAEKGMAKAREEGNEQDYRYIQFSILGTLQQTKDVLGLRELARKFWRESKDMSMYRVVKNTYVPDEWQRIAAAYIDKLEKKMPLYIEGTEDPAELAEAYLEEYDDGNALEKLLQTIPRLPFLNQYAPRLGEGHDGNILLLYRDVLLNFAGTHQQGDDPAEFLTGLQNMSDRTGGKLAVSELSNEIKTLNKPLHQLIPAGLKKSPGNAPSFYQELAQSLTDGLYDKGKAALTKQQYQEAAAIATAMAAVGHSDAVWKKYKGSYVVEYANKGFELALTVYQSPLPQELSHTLFRNALQYWESSEHLMQLFPIHWIELLIALPKSDEERVLAIVNSMLPKLHHSETPKLTRLLKLKASLLLSMGRKQEVETLMATHERIAGLREYLIQQADASNDHPVAQRLASEGIRIHASLDKTLYRRFLHIALELAKKYNDIEGIRKHAHMLYNETKDLEYYRTIKKTYEPTEWPGAAAIFFINKLENNGKKFSRYNVASWELCAVYAEEDLLDHLLSVVERADNFELTERYAGKLYKIFPDALLKLYSDGIKEYAADNKNAEAIDRIADLFRTMKQWERGSIAVQKLREEFRDMYPTRTKLLKEIGKI
jgi:hypothetical protein